MYGDKIQQDGSFIYSTSVNKDLIGVPESKANPDQIEAAKQGKSVSGLRGYGSITYAGFKSYLYANLDRDDPRVVAAHDWIRRNFVLDRNPGMPDPIHLHGLFYYYMTMGRALNAWGSTYIEAPDGTRHDWANELIAHLVSAQREDGSWVNSASRWMEDNPALVTAYSLIALQNAMN
jgi:squalene-hopene/tetraprenyl-beta-curcumene cyclase